MDEDISKLKLEIEELKNRNNELEKKLKSYTNPTRNKKYYEKNSDIVKESNPEKLKEWRHNAYLNRKEKLKGKNRSLKLRNFRCNTFMDLFILFQSYSHITTKL